MNKNGGKSYLETTIEELIENKETDKLFALARLLPRAADLLQKCYIRLGSKQIKSDINQFVSDAEQTIREN